MRELRIQFKKGKDGVQHSVRLERPDGSCDWSYIRSLVHHDLVHYVVESHFKIARGFYGEVLFGTTLATLAAAGVTKAHNWHSDIFLAEALVNAFQESLHLDEGLAPIVAALESLSGHGLLLPEVSERCLNEVRYKIAKLWAEWEQIELGQSLRLIFAL